MHPLFLLLCLLFLFTQPGELPRFEDARCPRTMPTNANCGYLNVPEDRTNPDSPTIRLAVAIFRTRSSQPMPDPLLFLDGGPGSRTLDAWSKGIDQLIMQVGNNRDVIVFDQRGMGYSEPALTCPEQADPENANWLTECRDRWISGGVNLAAYTTRENAADAADLMRTLGYTSYNVWGGSYGSSLALALLRDHPEGIRSVVVTALQPPDLQASLGPMIQRTIDLLGEQCAADSACSAAFPGDLHEKVAVVVNQLNEAPFSADVGGMSQTLDGNSLITALGQVFKDVSGLANAPALVEALYQQQYGIVLPYAAALSPDSSYFLTNPSGAYYSIRCTDSILATTPDQLEAALSSIDPAFREAFRQQTARQVAECQTWGAHVPTNAEKALPVSDVPVLIMNGELDPYSSPEAVAASLETLPNGHALWFPGYGHGINADPCAKRIFRDFIADPSQIPDATCIARIPPLHFTTP